MEEVPKFKCSACGKCCRIRGFSSEEKKKFVEEYGYGKMPIVHVVPIDEISFPLWDFEAKRFKEYENDKKIDANIRPSKGIMDLNSDRFIVLNYHMNSEECPFLSEDGKCSIYEKRRAFICSLFPFNRSPFLDIGKKEGNDIFGDCPNILKIIDKLDYENKKTFVSQLYGSFGQTFLAAVQHDHIIEWSNRLVIDMMKNKVIRPAINYPYAFLLKRIENAEKIDFTDFIVEAGIMKKDDPIGVIKKFESFADAKKIVEEYLDDKNLFK